MNCKTVVSMLTTVLLATSLVFIGCGAVDDNSQPSIEAIPDKVVRALENDSLGWQDPVR